MFTHIQRGFRTSAKVSLLTAVAVSFSFAIHALGQSTGGISDGTYSAGKPVTGLSNLPPGAQRRVAEVLGKDDPTYWLHQNREGFGGEIFRNTLATEFTTEGAEVRAEAGGEVPSHTLNWGLQTLRYGYGLNLRRVKAVTPHAKANRVEYRRDNMTEWYENGPLGLEQGFTLLHPPVRARQGRNGEPLTLEMALTGDLAATIEPGAKALALRSRDGEVALRYTGLEARDAAGRELPSWLELRNEKLLVRVEDMEAQYPVVIDPWIQTAELTASDGFANDFFGNSVAIDGSTVIVGAPYHSVGSYSEQGAAYVFVKSGSGWIQQAELTETGGANEDHFGYAVALSGSTAVVGSWTAGVHVFVRSNGTWTQQAELAGGYPVAVSGSTIVLGETGEMVGSKNGAAAVYVGNAGTWTQQAELTGSDEGSVDKFGSSVAIYGNTVVVGAPTHQVGANGQAGAVYVFVNSNGTWSQQAELLASDGTTDDQFGNSVAIYGSTIVAGAYLHEAGSNPHQGTAYVFSKSGTTWTQQAELWPSDGLGDDQFGTSVAVSASTVLVGSPYHPNPDPFPWNPGPGAAYTFVKSGTTWSQQSELLASDASGFGTSVAVSGSTAVVGALNSTEPGGKGAAYVYGSTGPLYTMSVAPNSLSMAPGGQGTATVTITPFNGFTGNVSLSGALLPKGVTASFTPNPATSTGTVTITASATAAEGAATLILNGTSGTLTQTAPLPLTVLPAPEASLSTTATSFGNVVINTTSAGRTITVKNTGQEALSFTKAPMITPGTNFKITGNGCTTILFNTGDTCSVSVDFVPTTLGKMTASLIFSDNAVNSPQSVSLTGFGVVPATLTPAIITYALQKVGTTSATKTVTLINYQTVALSSIAISTTGDFAVSATTCTSSLAAKAKCTINVTFKPTQTGTRAGQLTVTDNASNSPQSSALKGTGD